MRERYCDALRDDGVAECVERLSTFRQRAADPVFRVPHHPLDKRRIQSSIVGRVGCGSSKDNFPADDGVGVLPEAVGVGRSCTMSGRAGPPRDPTGPRKSLALGVGSRRLILPRSIVFRFALDGDEQSTASCAIGVGNS